MAVHSTKCGFDSIRAEGVFALEIVDQSIDPRGDISSTVYPNILPHNISFLHCLSELVVRHCKIGSSHNRNANANTITASQNRAYAIRPYKIGSSRSR
jgi:hypothetical protein